MDWFEFDFCQKKQHFLTLQYLEVSILFFKATKYVLLSKISFYNAWTSVQHSRIQNLCKA